MDLPYPYGVLDYESSGLDDNTYPIEIGIAIKRSAAAPIESWGSLIRPCAAWTEFGYWNPEAEQIHHIARQELAEAPTLEQVARKAMKFAGNTPLYFDGGRFDLYWHSRFVAACPELELNLQPVQMIVDMKGYIDAFADLKIEHRAEADAIQNIEVLEKLAGQQP